MKVQCSHCGFVGKFEGSHLSSCPLCKRGFVETVEKTSTCSSCSTQFSIHQSFCPCCGVEKLSRSRSRENLRQAISDPKK